MLSSGAVSGYGVGVNNQPNQVLAAGGVLWRLGAAGIEVAAVYRPTPGNWSLPKGKLNAGEHLLLGACREVEEETGLSPVPQVYLTRASYQLSRPEGPVTKVVDFWSMRARNPHAAFVPNEEVTRQRWIPLAEAGTVLERPRDQQALAVFTSLPTVTASVLLLRHAPADHGFAGPDSARPLSTSGRAQVAQLTGLLALYDPAHVFSATPLRCVKTVSPLASVLNQPVNGESVFDAEESNPERAATRVREIAVDGGGVICSQAPVIADMLAILADSDDVKLPSLRTDPGQAWALSFSGQTLVAAQRL